LKKNIKSPYLCNRLIDFDEIWHGDPYSGRPLKFELLKIQDGGGGQLKITKSRYLRSGLTDFYEMWYGDAKWVS